MLNMLLIGSGGREDALAWKLAQSPRLGELWCAPGNPGMARHDRTVKIAVEDVEGLVQFAIEKKIHMAFCGPEAPLVAGLVDRFRKAGLRIVGPTAEAAKLEGSKSFAKQFMIRHEIPTARYEKVVSVSKGLDLVKKWGTPIVIKADGLAGGKGVQVCETAGQAADFLKDLLEKKVFGAAGGEVLVEQCLSGQEVTLMAFCDGKTLAPMPPCQDHKRVMDGDTGPNTGGMGAYAPAPCVTEEIESRIRREILDPFLRGIQADHLDFRGVVYFGLMLTPDGPKVLEFNVRFGDPETQAVLLLLQTDLVEILEACDEGRLAGLPIRWREAASVCVVLTSGGYPGSFEKGKPIRGIEAAEKVPGVTVFHAGTALSDDELLTSGGRVLGVTALEASLDQAILRAYQGAGRIQFDKIHYRRDIGAKALAMARSAAAAQ